MSEKKIFEPAKLNNIVLKNRLIRSATWEGMADIDGHIPDKLYDTYEDDHCCGRTSECQQHGKESE